MNLVFGRETYDCIRQAATERQATEAPMYALETDLDRTNVSVRELDKKLADLIEHYNEHIDHFNENALWSRSIFSNLYEAPFPPATAAEWHEAHFYNETWDWPSRRRERPRSFGLPIFPPATDEEWDEAHHLNHQLTYWSFFADDFMSGLLPAYRDEADCQCSCCQERGK